MKTTGYLSIPLKTFDFLNKVIARLINKVIARLINP